MAAYYSVRQARPALGPSLRLAPKPGRSFLASGTAGVDERLRAPPCPCVFGAVSLGYAPRSSFWVAVHEHFCCLMAPIRIHFKLIIPSYKVSSRAGDAAASSPPGAGLCFPECFDLMAGKRPPHGFSVRVHVRVFPGSGGQPSSGAAP